MMAKIILLGSNGQLGSDLCKVLLNHDVIALTRTDINALEANATQALEPYVDADYVINCIATTNVDGCEDDPRSAYSINTSFVTELAKFCHQHDMVLFHISTDYVFDGVQRTHYTEESQPSPLNVYGLSKYAGELAVQRYAPRHFILRVASLFGEAGAAGKGGNFVTTMRRLASEKPIVKVIDDQWTCPTHTLDIAKAILAMIEQQASDYGIYPCVSSSSCSWFEFAREIMKQSGYDPEIIQPTSYLNYQFKAQRPQYGVMKSTKLSRYYQMPTFEAALSEYLELKGWLEVEIY